MRNKTRNLVLLLSATTAFTVYGGVNDATTGGLSGGLEARVGVSAHATGASAQAASAEEVAAPMARASVASMPAQANLADEVKDSGLKSFIRREKITDPQTIENLVAKLGRLQALSGTPLSEDEVFLGKLSKFTPAVYETFLATATAIIGTTKPGREEAGKIIRDLATVSPTMFVALSQTVSEYAPRFSKPETRSAWIRALIFGCYRASDQAKLNELAYKLFNFASKCVGKKKDFNESNAYGCLLIVARANIPDIPEFIKECSRIEGDLGLPFLQSVMLSSEKPGITSKDLGNIFKAIRASFELTKDTEYGDKDIADFLYFRISPALWSDVAGYLKTHKSSLKNVTFYEFSNYLANRMGGLKITDVSSFAKILDGFLAYRGIAPVASAMGAAAAAPIARP